MHRFYIPSPDIKSGIITIHDKYLLHQITRVLRMKPKDQFSVFDDRATERVVEIIEIDRKKVLGQMMERIERQTEPPIQVSLYQAIPKKTALFELIIQKATELGVAHIYPLITERTENRRLSKFERLHSIAIEAAEQSGRLTIPTIHHPVSLDMAFGQVSNAYMAYEFENQNTLLSYGQSLFEGRSFQLMIGPEGGLSASEVESAKKAGVRLFTLGPRILRTETAAIVALGLFVCNQQNPV